MAIVNGYATLPEVKAELRLVTTNDDPRIERAIEAASRVIDNITHRQFFATASQARTFGAWGTVVFVDDAQGVTQVEQSTDQTTWTTVATTAYVTNPRPPVRQLTRTDGADWAGFVRVTATWGTSTVPTEVHEACIIQAIRLFKRADTPEGVLTGDFGAARLARIDPDVLALIRPLARKVVG